MRILEVIYSFRVGGSEIVGIEIAEALRTHGVEVACAALSPGGGPLRDRCVEAGIAVVDLDIPDSNVLARNGFSLRLARLLRAGRFDAIHLHHMLGLHKLGLPARLAGIPRIVVTEHSLATLQGSRWARLRARLSWRLAHEFTAVHEGIRDYLVEEIGVDERRVAVIANGLKLGHWQCSDRAERRAQLQLGTDYTFVFVGRVEPVKNVPELVAAFLMFQAGGGPPAQLLVVGSGSQLAACREIAAADPLGARVRFLGELSEPRTAMAAADAFVMNSISEGSPRAMIEAMAMGLPCICPAVGGVKVLLEGRGWLTEPRDRAALARGMAAMAGDPEAARAIGQQGREFVHRRFDAAESVRAYRRLFNAGAGRS